MGRLRIAAISYLNTAPLMWDFEHGDAGREFDISYTIPSSCAAALRDASADIGIIPAIAYAGIPDLLIIPKVAIAARRAVRSILLISKVPIEETSRIAVDSSSLTSVALLRVLLGRKFGGGRSMISMPPDLAAMLQQCDAGLLIGDPALTAKSSGYFVYDLAEEWNRLTGKSFVFAFWAVRRAALQDEPRPQLAGIFQKSRDHGLQAPNLRQIARDWSRRLAMSESDVIAYLTENIHFQLDSGALEGLQLFFRYAQECGVIAEVPSLRFLDRAA